MSQCYAATIKVPCRCTNEFTAKVWLMVHKEERPDLYRQVESGRLNDVVCDHCGRNLILEYPVFVNEPDTSPPLAFYPGRGPTLGSPEEQANWLLDSLRRRMGEHWQENWLSQGVRFSSVPLGDLADESGPDFQAMAERDTVVEAIQELLAAKDKMQLRQIIDSNPALLSDFAEAILENAISSSGEADNQAGVRDFKALLNLIRQCREIGVPMALAKDDSL